MPAGSGARAKLLWALPNETQATETGFSHSGASRALLILNRMAGNAPRNSSRRMTRTPLGKSVLTFRQRFTHSPQTMKLKRRGSGGSSIVTNSRWMAYATAGAASALMCVNSAEAMIHYSGLINEKFIGSAFDSFPLDQRGNFDLTHNPHFYSTFSIDGGSAHFGIFGQVAGSVAGFYTCAYNSDVASVSNLNLGDAISARPFVPGGGLLATLSGFACGGGGRGQFFAAGVAFIGFKVNNGSGDQYGWVRLDMRGCFKKPIKLIDYAHGDVDDPI